MSCFSRVLVKKANEKRHLRPPFILEIRNVSAPESHHHPLKDTNWVQNLEGLSRLWSVVSFEITAMRIFIEIKGRMKLQLAIFKIDFLYLSQIQWFFKSISHPTVDFISEGIKLRSLEKINSLDLEDFKQRVLVQNFKWGRVIKLGKWRYNLSEVLSISPSFPIGFQSEVLRLQWRIIIFNPYGYNNYKNWPGITRFEICKYYWSVAIAIASNNYNQSLFIIYQLFLPSYLNMTTPSYFGGKSRWLIILVLSRHIRIVFIKVIFSLLTL